MIFFLGAGFPGCLHELSGPGTFETFSRSSGVFWIIFPATWQMAGFHTLMYDISKIDLPKTSPGCHLNIFMKEWGVKFQKVCHSNWVNAIPLLNFGGRKKLVVMHCFDARKVSSTFAVLERRIIRNVSRLRLPHVIKQCMKITGKFL